MAKRMVRGPSKFMGMVKKKAMDTTSPKSKLKKGTQSDISKERVKKLLSSMTPAEREKYFAGTKTAEHTPGGRRVGRPRKVEDAKVVKRYKNG